MHQNSPQAITLGLNPHAPIGLTDLARVLAHSEEGVSIMDPDGNIAYINNAHLQIFGYDNAQELLGRSWRTFYNEEWITGIESVITPILMRDNYWKGITTVLRRDGSPLTIQITLIRLPDNKVACNFRPFSPAHTSPTPQISTCTLSERLIAALPLRMRKHLDLLGGYTNFFLDEIDDNQSISPEILRAGLNNIHAVRRHFVTQMQRFEVFSRLSLSSPNQTFLSAPHHWIQQLTKSSHAIAKSFRRSQDFSLHFDPANLLVDFSLLEFVIREILSNAFQFSRPNDAVKITGTISDDSYFFRICDDGIGLGNTAIPADLSSPSQAPEKFGLDLVTATLHRINAEISSVANDDFTTCIQVRLPAQEITT